MRDADGAPVRDAAGRVRVRLAGGQGSHVLSALAAADALAVIPEPLERAEAGTEVELRWLDRGVSHRTRTASHREQEGPMDRSDATRAERRRLTHVDRRGRPRMVDVSAKPATARRAVAEAEVAVSAETMSLVIDGGGEKGDVLTVAELAGVMGGKRTAELIPLCHPLPLTDLVVVDHARPRRGRPAGPRRGRDDGADRRRDGGDDRRVGRRAHRLRHGQGRRARASRCGRCG